jgi:hypothetical protein
MHVALPYIGSEKGFNYFWSYVCSIFMYFYKRLYLGLKLMTSWSQGNGFITASGFPFKLLKLLL